MNEGKGLNPNSIIPDAGRGKLIARTFLSGKTGKTKTTYEYQLNKLARYKGAEDAFSFDWSSLRYPDIMDIRAWLVENWKPESVRLALTVLKGILETSYDLQLLTADDLMRAIKPTKFKVKKNINAATGRMLTPEEIAALLKTCQKGERNRAIRDAAILMLMVSCGLRREEVTTLQFTEYDQETGRLIVHGKGDKDRTAYLINGAHVAMNAWIHIRGNEPGPLFQSIVKSDTITGKAINVVSVWSMIKMRQQMAGIPAFTPHDLRRTCISNMIDLGIDMFTIASIVGHGSPEITSRYDRRNETRKIEGFTKYHVPFTVREDE